MDNGNSSKPIPAGWTFVNKVGRKGPKASYYLCTATGQHFFTYEELINYVTYAEAEKLSIYSPTFSAAKKRARGRGKKPKSKGECSKATINQSNKSKDGDDEKYTDLEDVHEKAESALLGKDSNGTSLVSDIEAYQPHYDWPAAEKMFDLDHIDLATEVPLEDFDFSKLAFLDCEAFPSEEEEEEPAPKKRSSHKSHIPKATKKRRNEDWGL